MRRLFALFALLALSLSSSPLFAQRPGASSGSPPPAYSINGFVRDGTSDSPIGQAQVEIRNQNGAKIGTAQTDMGGNFSFEGLTDGRYYIDVTQVDGYDSAEQSVDLRGTSIFGLPVPLSKMMTATHKEPGATVSARELSIPQKAHDAMEKGMELLYKKSDARKSIDQFHRAVDLYPDYYEAYDQMGMAYMNLGDTADAEQSLRKSMEVSKERDAEAYAVLAMLYTNGERFSDSEPLARKAVELDQNSWQGNFELARALLGLKRPTDAAVSAAAAAQLKPDYAPVYLILANAHMQEKDLPDLLTDVNSYLKIQPTGPSSDQARQIRDSVQQQLARRQTSIPAPSAAPAPPSPSN